MAEPQAETVLVESRILDACESAVCPCEHVALDHSWHGCEECACGRSAIHAVLASGVIPEGKSREQFAVRLAADDPFVLDGISREGTLFILTRRDSVPLRKGEAFHRFVVEYADRIGEWEPLSRPAGGES